MGIEDLTLVEIIGGTLSLVYSVIGIIIGLIIISKYYFTKRKELLGVAFAIILSVIAWISSGISFLTYILFDYLFEAKLYLFLNYGFLLFANLSMIYAIVSLIYPKSLKKIVLIFLIIAVSFDILLIYLLYTNIALVGTMAGKFDSEAATIPTLMVIFVLITAVIYRVLFIKEFYKAKDKKLQWRGRFILIEVILMVIGSLIDAMASVNLTTLIIARILLVLRLLFIYLGWLLPDRVAKWLIRSEK
jgi:hypothetical protein